MLIQFHDFFFVEAKKKYVHIKEKEKLLKAYKKTRFFTYLLFVREGKEKIHNCNKFRFPISP